MSGNLKMASFSLFQTEIYVEEGLLKGSFLKELCENKKPVLIVDENIKDLYGTPLSALHQIELLSVPSGEKAKTKEVKESIEQKLFEKNLGRDSVIISLGGGATSDLVGFIASTYLRGIPLILIPTTLLGMIDAAIGGKNSINTSFGKNLLGTIYHPQAILADPEVLLSLPEKEWMNGLAEMLKMALIADKELWDLLEDNLSRFKELSQILRAIEGKVKVVEKDPKEKNIRRLLNFGHTIAHALESLSEYSLSHGEAVLIGSVTEAHLSAHLGYLPQKDLKRIQTLYSSFSLSLPKNYSREKLFSAFSFDKKKEEEKIRFVLIDRIGRGLSFENQYCLPVSKQELDQSLSWMEKTYG